MDNAKLEFIRGHFEQIESQVQFGDAKASLLIAGNSLLLVVSGALMKIGADCPGDSFAIACMKPSVVLGLSTLSSAVLVWSLMCALRAARPSSVHKNPPVELFLMSHVARLSREDFIKVYRDATIDELTREALITIYGKAPYATRKFRWLKRAVDATLLSLVCMLAASGWVAAQAIAKWQ